MFGKAAAVAVAAVAMVGLAGCADGSSSAADGQVGVVTAFYPIQEAATRIGGDAVVVTDLTPPGVEPHDLELTADDLEAVASADLILYFGGGFQPAVEDAVQSAASGGTVDILAELVSSNAYELTADPEGELSIDPHVWLDTGRPGGHRGRHPRCPRGGRSGIIGCVQGRVRHVRGRAHRAPGRVRGARHLPAGAAGHGARGLRLPGPRPRYGAGGRRGSLARGGAGSRPSRRDRRTWSRPRTSTRSTRRSCSPARWWIRSPPRRAHGSTCSTRSSRSRASRSRAARM